MLNANILNTKINFRWLESMKVKQCKVVKGKMDSRAEEILSEHD